MECFHICLTNGLMQLFNVYMLLFKSSLPLVSDYWADPVAHLHLLKSSMAEQFFPNISLHIVTKADDFPRRTGPLGRYESSHSFT